MSETLIAQPWRCLKSGNPVGTDTYQIGFSCQCQVCRADAEITFLRAQLAEARARTIEDVAEDVETETAIAPKAWERSDDYANGWLDCREQALTTIRALASLKEGE